MSGLKRPAQKPTRGRRRRRDPLEQRVATLEKIVATIVAMMSAPSDVEEEPDEAELAAALERYTNPLDPEYDAEFTAELRRIRPDWFEEN